MSFSAAQDHKAAGRDTTLSTPSSIRREDPTATTLRRSRYLLSFAVVLVFVSLIMNYIVVELVLLIINYIVNLMICVILLLRVILLLCVK
jgi:amino acid transporter